MWKQSFNFNGRATQSEFWLSILFTLIIGIIFTCFNLQLEFGQNYLFIIFLIAIIIPIISLTVRRLHDIGRSGCWIFIRLIPLIGGIWLLILLCTESDNFDNLYGEKKSA